MKRLFIVTGAYGHLGNTIIKKLLAKGENVRALVLPAEKSAALDGLDLEIVRGDICRADSLGSLFTVNEPTEIIVIHTAGIVSIASKYQKKVRDVNVNGTANIIKMCLKHQVKRLVYISSVHAIPEKNGGEVITEVDSFSPERVFGLYSKTKAEATQLVLDSVKKGLDAVVVHPSGIIGPQDYGRSHTTQLIIDYLEGRLIAGIKGGYDFVDVRDVADGTIAAAEKGRRGECYILSGRYIQVCELLMLLHEISGKRKISITLPLWFVKATASLSEFYYKLLRQPPLYTSYSLYVLGCNANFSHEKATRELGYSPRDIRETLVDTVEWLMKNKRVQI